MTLALHSLVLLLLLWLIGRQQPQKTLFYVGALLKISAGIALGLIFQQDYWGGDTWQYYRAGMALAELPLGEWWHQMLQPEIGHFSGQPRAILFAKITSGFLLLSGGSYWIAAAHLSFLSFLAFWFFYRQIRSTLPNIAEPAAFAFLLFPSTVFWSSGIMKGTLTNAAIVFAAAYLLKVFYRKQILWIETLGLVLSLALLYWIKYYFLMALLPVLLYALLDGQFHRARIAVRYRAIVFSVIVAATLLVGPFINPNLNVLRLPENIYRNQQTSFVPTEGDSNIEALRIEAEWDDLITAAPVALFHGLYGPTPFDRTALWGLVPKAENLFLLGMSLFSLALLRKRRLYRPDILVTAVLLFTLTLALVLPLASPNFGALVRYKAAFLPFFTLVVCVLPWWHFQEKQNR